MDDLDREILVSAAEAAFLSCASLYRAIMTTCADEKISIPSNAQVADIIVEAQLTYFGGER